MGLKAEGGVLCCNGQVKIVVFVLVASAARFWAFLWRLGQLQQPASGAAFVCTQPFPRDVLLIQFAFDAREPIRSEDANAKNSVNVSA